MEFKLSDEQRQMVASVRAVSQQKIKPRAKRYMDGTYPHENFRDLAEIGVLGMAVPVEHGGSDLPVLETALVVEEVSKACYVTGIALIGMLGVQTRIISNFAPDHLKRRILPGVGSGKIVLAICMTEPHAGTDVANYRTNTTIRGDKAVIKGAKTLISRVEEADWFIIFTRIDNRPGREGIGCVLLERNTPGFNVIGKFHTMGGENLAEIAFDNCEVPIENVILREDGFKKLINAFNTQRCLNPSISLGLAEGAFEEAVRYARQREAFGRPIGQFQGMRWKFAEMYRDIEVGRSMLYRACATANPFPDPYQAAVAKMYCNEMAIRVTSEAVQVFGGFGYTDDCPAQRLYRGARYGTLGGGTTETLKELVGKRIMSDFPDVDGFLGTGTF
ncbi:MAG: acyl-CoA dehydrogenase family protein [Hyphomicrobiaceae bacterium]